MFKLIFGLAFVSMVLGKAYPGFQSLGSEKYFISNDKLDYHQAYASCKVDFWTLATEQTPELTKILNEEVKNSKRSAKDYWIGGFLLDDSSSSPLWMWLDLGDTMGYTNWAGEEEYDSKKGCLLKSTEGDNAGKWTAAACSEKHNYICRMI